MKTKICVFLSIILLAVPFSTWAQTDSSKDKKEVTKQTKKTTKKKSGKVKTVRTEISIGFYSLDEDSYRYGKYSGLTSSDGYVLADFKLDKRPDPKSSDTTRWTFQGRRLGLDSRHLEFDYRQQGTQRFKISYSEIPNHLFNDGLTPFREEAPGIWNLPPGWQVKPPNSTTRGLLNLQENLLDLSIDTKRRRLDLAYERRLGPNWTMDFDYRHETRKGERTLGGIIGFNWFNPRGAILPAPVDFTTDILEATMGYATSRLQLNFGIYASFFGNDEETLVFQNPFARQSQWAAGVGFPNSQGRIALEPDNSYLQFRVTGGLGISATTRLTADVSFGRVEQDDAFLPYTINPNLTVNTALPATNLDGKIDTTMLNLRLTSKLAQRLGLTVNYHYNDRDNKTPRRIFPYVGADSQDQRAVGDGRINSPYSYTRQKSDAIMTFRFSGAARLKAGIEYSDYNREFSDVEDADELTWLASALLRGWSKVSMRLGYRNSDRDVSNYNPNSLLIGSFLPGEIGGDDFLNHPQLRKYYLTDRERDEYRFRADFFPNAQFNLGVSVSEYKDDYDAGFFGLNEAKVTSWSVDGGWYPIEQVALTAFYSNEEYDASQSSRHVINSSSAADPNYNWFAESEDRVDTYNIALKLTGIGADKNGKGFEFGLDYTYSNTENTTRVVAVSADTAPLPDLLSEMRTFSIWSSFAMGDRASVRLAAENAKFESKDWGLDGVAPDTLSNVLLLGQSAANYNLWLISASLSYRF